MTSSKLLLIILVASVGPWANASLCYRAKVDQTSVVGLKGPAQLLFMPPPAQGEGRIYIRGSGTDAENVVDKTLGQPIRYILEGAAGSFVQGAQGTATTLNVRGALGIQKVGRGADAIELIYVERGTSRLAVTPQIYVLEMMTEAECRSTFTDLNR